MDFSNRRVGSLESKTTKPNDNRSYCNPLLSIGFRFFPSLRNANSSGEGIRQPGYHPAFRRSKFFRHGGTQPSCGAGAGCNRGFGRSWVPNLIGLGG